MNEESCTMLSTRSAREVRERVNEEYSVVLPCWIACCSTLFSCSSPDGNDHHDGDAWGRATEYSLLVLAILATEIDFNKAKLD